MNLIHSKITVRLRTGGCLATIIKKTQQAALFLNCRLQQKRKCYAPRVLQPAKSALSDRRLSQGKHQMMYDEFFFLLHLSENEKPQCDLK